jgi:hypothetical protein
VNLKKVTPVGFNFDRVHPRFLGSFTIKATVLSTRADRITDQETIYAGYREILEKVKPELERYPDELKLTLSSELKSNNSIYDEEKRSKVSLSYPLDHIQVTFPTDFQDSFSRDYILNPFEGAWVQGNYHKKLIDQADQADNRLKWFQGVVDDLMQKELPRLAKLLRWEIKPLGKDC